MLPVHLKSFFSVLRQTQAPRVIIYTASNLPVNSHIYVYSHFSVLYIISPELVFVHKLGGGVGQGKMCVSEKPPLQEMKVNREHSE